MSRNLKAHQTAQHHSDPIILSTSGLRIRIGASDVAWNAVVGGAGWQNDVVRIMTGATSKEQGGGFGQSRSKAHRPRNIILTPLFCHRNEPNSLFPKRRQQLMAAVLNLALQNDSG